MEKHLENPISEQQISRFIEHQRKSYSAKLNYFLKAIKYSNSLKNKRSTLQIKDRFFHDIFPVYDESGKIHWDTLQLFIPHHFEESVMQSYPMFCENEVRLCCLLIFDVPPKTILNILNYNNLKTIYSTSFTIRQKAGVKEVREIFEKIKINQISIL